MWRSPALCRAVNGAGMDSTGMDGTGRAEGTVPGRQQRGHPAKRPPERAQQRCIGQHISLGPTSTCPLVQDGWRRTVGDAGWRKAAVVPWAGSPASLRDVLRHASGYTSASTLVAAHSGGTSLPVRIHARRQAQAGFAWAQQPAWPKAKKTVPLWQTDVNRREDVRLLPVWPCS